MSVRLFDCACTFEMTLIVRFIIAFRVNQIMFKVVSSWSSEVRAVRWLPVSLLQVLLFVLRGKENGTIQLVMPDNVNINLVRVLSIVYLNGILKKF